MKKEDKGQKYRTLGCKARYINSFIKVAILERQKIYSSSQHLELSRSKHSTSETANHCPPYNLAIQQPFQRQKSLSRTALSKIHNSHNHPSHRAPYNNCYSSKLSQVTCTSAKTTPFDRPRRRTMQHAEACLASKQMGLGNRMQRYPAHLEAKI